jgi:hypothetical protein
MIRTFTLTLGAALALAFALEAGVSFKSLQGFSVVSEARAEVGRPLTATSVAGVARRTSRRCNADVYKNC